LFSNAILNENFCFSLDSANSGINCNNLKNILKIFCVWLAFGPKLAYNTYMPQTMWHPRQSGGSGIWKQNG
jgi:hypothetical protein